MNCPSCGAEMVDVSLSTNCPGEKYCCDGCHLGGPSHVLEQLAARLATVGAREAELERLRSPAVVLAEAERLLRSVRAPLAVTTFVDAYARLLRMQNEGPR